MVEGAVGSGELGIEEVTDGQNGDVAEGMEGEKVLVAGDDEVGAAGYGTIRRVT
jgi:hypothetical protein